MNGVTPSPNPITPESRLQGQAFEITSPSPGGTAIVTLIVPTPGTIAIEGVYDPGQVAELRAYVQRLGDTVGPNTPHASAVKCHLQTLANQHTFSHPAVPNAEGGADNRLDVWALDGSGNVVKYEGRQFNGVVKTTVTVRGNQCVWFAFKGNELMGPANLPSGSPQPLREAGGAYRPVTLAIPAGATDVTIAASGGSTWGHHPGVFHSAAGTGNGEAVFADYKTEADATITEPSASIKLCALEGLWITDRKSLGGAHVNAGELFSIGAGVASVSVPAGALELDLGFHDGYEWGNNHGSIEVAVTWTVPPPAVA